MSQETGRSIVAAKWKAVWNAGALKTMAVEVQNQKFVRPKNQVWGRYTFLPGETVSISVGVQGQSRTPFALILQIFHPEDTGTTEAYRAADILDALSNTMHRAPDGMTVVHFQRSGLEGVGKRDGFEAFNVTIPGYFDTYGPTVPEG